MRSNVGKYAGIYYDEGCLGDVCSNKGFSEGNNNGTGDGDETVYSVDGDNEGK